MPSISCHVNHESIFLCVPENCRLAGLYFFLVAKSAIEKLTSPVIIDNTNTQAWEMKPYVSMVR